MLVKKQVSSSIKNVKNRGIVGVVRVIDNMVWERKEVDSGSDELDNSFGTVESLPTKLSKVAANYIGKSQCAKFSEKRKTKYNPIHFQSWQ